MVLILAKVQEMVVVEAGLTVNDGAVKFMWVAWDYYMDRMDDLDDLDKLVEVDEVDNNVEHARDTIDHLR